jgi:hypothetical protein
VAEPDRYAIASLDQLAGDCASVHVEQPDAATMAPYASAYFERQRLLFGAPPVALRELYETYLFPPHRERLPPASPLAGSVETVMTVESLTVLEPPADGVTRFMLLAPQGVFFLEAPGADDTTSSLRYGLANGTLDTIPRDLWAEADGLVMGGAAYGPERLILMSLAQASDRGRLTLVDLRRADGTWTATRSTPIDDDVFVPGVAIDPTGTPHLFTLAFDGASPYLYVHTPLDPETLDPGTPAPLEGGGFPMAVGASGEVYSFADGTILLTGTDGVTMRYAGQLLPGFEDSADPLAAEFSEIRAMMPTGDGGMILIDTDAVTGQPVIRGVAPAGP